MHFRARFIFLLGLALVLFLRTSIIGMALEPFLEQKLSYLFGTKVSMRVLRIDPFNGKVKIKEFIIDNQPEFSDRPHFKTGLEFTISFSELFRKHVLIDSLILHNGYFLIEKNIHENGDEITNIRTWINHMKALGGSEEEQKPEEKKEGGWKVTLNRQVLDNVIFIYESYYLKNHGLFKRYAFENLYGELVGFEWPTPDPGKLTQPVSARGFIGMTRPAPVWAKGMANFASDTVSFDLTGEIRGGSMTEYQFFWTGLPVKVVKGEYDLYAHAVCDKGRLKWDNDLIIRNLRLKNKRTASAFIWGLPIQASIRFLESQKTIELKVPVEGDVTNPAYDPGLGRAFQEALTRYTQTGMKALKMPVKLMARTGEEVVVAPVKVVEKVSDIVKKPWSKEGDKKAEEEKS